MLHDNPIAYDLQYEYLHKTYRLLHHQALNKLLRYPKIPRKTTNFDIYPIAKDRIQNQLTLGAAVTTRYARTIFDPIITEIWLADEISMQSGFLYELLYFFNTNISSNNHIIWYPKDKTDQAFSIVPIDLSVGSSEEMDVNPVHPVSIWDYRYITAEVRFSFRIRKIIEIPEGIINLEGV